MGKTLAILGAGNMGLAIADGVIRSGFLSPSEITLVRRNTSILSEYEKLGCKVSCDLVSSAKEADAVLLAVKPQMLKDVFPLISSACSDKLVISIAAGIKIESVRAALPGAMVVRAMPNTPLTVGEGVTELCRAENVCDGDFMFAKGLFECSGYTLECREEEINALTALTSSAVAYFAAVEDAMVEWALDNGLSAYDRQTVCDLVSKTAIGSAKLLYEKKTDPKALIKAVASPKGTTERALNVFSERNLQGVFGEAMTACLNRAEELSEIK